MKTTHSSCVGGLALLAAISLDASAVTVRVDPVAQSALVHSLVSANVTISGVNDGTAPALGHFNIDVGFNPATLQFMGVTFGDQLDVFGLGDIQDVLFDGVDSVNVLETSLDTFADVIAHQGQNFSLFTLNFKVLAQGTSLLTPSVITLADLNLDVFSADQTLDGSIRGAIQSAPEPSTSLLIFGGGMAWWVARTRRSPCSKGHQDQKGAMVGFNAIRNSALQGALCDKAAQRP